MSNTNEQSKPDDKWLFDMNGNLVEVKTVGGQILLYAWTITEDSVGRPYETHTDTMELTARQAIEIARRLLNAATDSKEDHL
jgi:hypothetical protein